MCDIITIDRGFKPDVTTPREFEAHFGSLPIFYDGYNVPIDELMDCCLCSVNIEKSLRKLNIDFKYFGMDYYVGDLENIVEE